MESMGTNHTAVVPVSGFPKAGPPRQVFLAGQSLKRTLKAS